MYHAIVAKKVRATFAGLSRGTADPLIDQLADDFEYSFLGDHAIGGTRTSNPMMHAWFERVFRLFPGLRFEVQDVAVTGPPWKTVALTHVAVYADDYANEMFQKINLRWGRLTKLVTLENLDVLREHLDVAAARGQTEAAAAPLTE